MSFKKELMEKFADNLMKMDKEEKKALLRYIIDSMGESFFADLTKEEKAAVMADSVQALAEAAGMGDRETQKVLLSELADTMVDKFTASMGDGDRGEALVDIAVGTIRRLAPEVKGALRAALSKMDELGPEVGRGLRVIVEDKELRGLVFRFVKALLVLLKDILVSAAREVYGYIKESGDEVVEFLKDVAKKAIKAIVRVGIELLRKAIDVIAGLLRSGGDTLLETKGWAERVWASDEMKAIRGDMERMVDERADSIRALLLSGVKDIDELAERTRMPRETIRNILLMMWERGEVALDVGGTGKGPAPSS